MTAAFAARLNQAFAAPRGLSPPFAAGEPLPIAVRPEVALTQTVPGVAVGGALRPPFFDLHRRLELLGA